jgi:prepilin-type N-terminal cleavage/methylation domain-containing protein
MNDAAERRAPLASPLPDRAGFSLIEVIVAMVLLCLVLVGLTGLSLTLSGRSIQNAGRSYETGLLTQEIDRAVAAPIESLAVQLGTTVIDTPVTEPWPFERSVAISGRADSLTVRIAIKPLAAAQTATGVTHSVLRTR